jgi:beta-phosphoglucomutase
MAARVAIYPPDEWKIREISFDPKLAARNETVFSLGNGHLGMRGNFEEGRCVGAAGTYINGFFEETPIVYGEIAYGYARNRQVMLNVADAKIIRLFVDNEPLDLSTGQLLSYERHLDLQEGVLTRTMRWRSSGGRVVDLTIRRLVSLTRRHVAAIHYELRSFEGTVRLESAIDGSVTNKAAGDDPRVGAHFREKPLQTIAVEGNGRRATLLQRTRNTKLTLACAVDHSIAPDDAPDEGRIQERMAAGGESAVLSLELAGGRSAQLTKYIGYCTSLECASSEVTARAAEAVDSAARAGFPALCAEQKSYLDDFWKRSDVRIDGDDSLQQGLRFNIWSLLQAAGRDGRTSVAAKGLSGEGYEGHYFWDTEIYVLPFFIYTSPAIARSLALYRIRLLDKARARAREMSQRGALYPWRTIGGEETSPYYPAGTAQYHIDADIVYALAKYVDATGDRGILLDGGAEMVFETARLWADLGSFIPEMNGDFCINEVTGPDEYSALVNNNLYTNLMAQANLELAAGLSAELAGSSPADYRRIAEKISLHPEEVERWKEAARRMRVPYDRGKGIHAQDDLFLSRAPWNFAGTPPQSFPLLLHYHPLVIYRFQVLKQPDVVLAQVLLGERFRAADKKRNFDYYNALTTGDSSLSPCIQSVAAAELGYTEEAYRYFSRTARMDLDDMNGNVSDGVHMAAMAGTWISLIYGFAGMRDRGGRLSFSPRLPARWRKLSFRLLYKGSTLSVALSYGKAVYEVLAGGSLTITHKGREIGLQQGAPAVCDLAPALECVVLDLDGVLASTAELHFRAWKRLCDELGIPFDRKVNERLKGVSRNESLQIILKEAGVDFPAEEKLRLAERKNGYYKELIGTVTPSDLLPGMSRLLAECKAAGIKLAVASVSHNVWEVVRRLGIQEMMDHIVDPAAVIKGKPDPEIFLRAAEMLGVPFECCVGVEDSQAGIRAIVDARMFAVGIGAGLTAAHWLLKETSELTFEGLRERFAAWSFAQTAIS